MDGHDTPERPQSRRSDLSAMAWRRPARNAEPNDVEPGRRPQEQGGWTGHHGAAGTRATGQNGSAPASGEDGSAEVDDTWTPPEPWSPPAWSPPEWAPANGTASQTEPEPSASEPAAPEPQDEPASESDHTPTEPQDWASEPEQAAPQGWAPEPVPAEPQGWASEPEQAAPQDWAPEPVPAEPQDWASEPEQAAPQDWAPEPVPAEPQAWAAAPAGAPASQAWPSEPAVYEVVMPESTLTPEALEVAPTESAPVTAYWAASAPEAEDAPVEPTPSLAPAAGPGDHSGQPMVDQWADEVEEPAAAQTVGGSVEPAAAALPEPEPELEAEAEAELAAEPEPVPAMIETTPIVVDTPTPEHPLVITQASAEPDVVAPAEEAVQDMAYEPVGHEPVAYEAMATEPEPEAPVADAGPSTVDETETVEAAGQWPAEEPASQVSVASAGGAPVPADDLPPMDALLPPAEGYREVGFDTVTRALATESEFQPYLELGLQPDEYAKIRQILGRRPTESELAMYAVMWSEHCSYKSSKVHLRQFAEKAPESDRLLAGIGANAGVIKISDKLAVTFKVESHNHPSFVEPHQGAATGVGGIVRDILAMGARPVAVMDPLRFGAADHEDTRRVLPGVVSGIGGYGNCLGLPNIGGEVVFDECYQGNPLVNALCVGVLPVDKLQQKAATGPGNVVVLIGAKTGRDGIGGVSVLASATFGQGSETRRPSVQVGDPFLEKLLIEACLEIYDLNLVVGIQDLGGAGLTCALTEMSAAAGLGMAVNLDLVPLREPSMRSEEILASESQERMMLIVTPENLPVVLSICARWGVLATAIGEVTPAESDAGGRLRIWWRGEVVVDVPPGSLADDGPVYARPMREPFERELMKVDRAETLPRPGSPEELRETVLRLVASPNLCDKSWVTEQYDRYVLGNTVLAQPEDGGVVRIDETTGLGVALSVDGNGRYAKLDPYKGAQLALAEAYRNVAVTGAVPVAVTNCLNFGSPEDAGVMWQFAEAVRGLADGCAQLGIPVTGGNVSFYNQTGGTAIHPTPIVGVLGVLSNVARRVPIGFSGEGDAIFLLGETRDEFGGSEWAHVVHRHLGGAPPSVDLEAEQRLAGLLAAAANRGHLTAAHDLSDGGLIQALVESCLRRNMGAHVALPPDGQSPFVHLFAESTGRAIVSVRKGQEQAFAALAGEHGVAKTALGIVSGTALVIDELFGIDLDDLRAAHTGTLPAIFS